MKVLIADDSNLFRHNLIDVLRDLEGVEIAGQAQSVDEVLDAIRAAAPDVLTLEVSMGAGRGIEVLKKVKRERLVPVVIVLTNHSSLPYRKRCNGAGADFFVDKTQGDFEMREIIQGLIPLFKQPSKNS